MVSGNEVVITGVGVLCPLGIGWDSVTAAAEAGQSGITRVSAWADAGLPICLLGHVPGFDLRQEVLPRKSLKLMSRDAHLAVSAALRATAHAGLIDLQASPVLKLSHRPAFDPNRIGVVCGADIVRLDLAEFLTVYQKSLSPEKLPAAGDLPTSHQHTSSQLASCQSSSQLQGTSDSGWLGHRWRFADSQSFATGHAGEAPVDFNCWDPQTQQQFDFARWLREGVPTMHPLAFLKNLPNMLAGHVTVALDARGPSNTIQLRAASSLGAIHEAVRVIQRGAADCMLAGAASSRLHPFDAARAALTEEMALGDHDPDSVMRPFDRARCGRVRAEGAVMLVLERLQHAQSRGASILARVVSTATATAARRLSGRRSTARQASAATVAALSRAIKLTLQQCDRRPAQLGHIVAQGLSGPLADRQEAEALQTSVPGVPVAAPSSYTGFLEAAAGGLQAVFALLALQTGRIPPIRNTTSVDPQCPVPVISSQALQGRPPSALLANVTGQAQAAAVLLEKVE